MHMIVTCNALVTNKTASVGFQRSAKHWRIYDRSDTGRFIGGQKLYGRLLYLKCRPMHSRMLYGDRLVFLLAGRYCTAVHKISRE